MVIGLYRKIRGRLQVYRGEGAHSAADALPIPPQPACHTAADCAPIPPQRGTKPPQGAVEELWGFHSAAEQPARSRCEPQREYNSAAAGSHSAARPNPAACMAGSPAVRGGPKPPQAKVRLDGSSRNHSPWTAAALGLGWSKRRGDGGSREQQGTGCQRSEAASMSRRWCSRPAAAIRNSCMPCSASLGLPRNPTPSRTFERTSGRASLSLQAGRTFDGMKWNDQPLPSGTRPRLVLINLCSEAVRTQVAGCRHWRQRARVPAPPQHRCRRREHGAVSQADAGAELPAT